MSGLHGALARESSSDAYDILISEENAKRLALSSMRSYAQQAVNVFPQLINLHPHCQGAMLSLIYNRGSGLHGKSVEEEDRRREMREIKNALEAGSENLVPEKIREMKRFWEGTGQRGLLKRRDQEADLSERGLKCNCWR